ncbi:hypothetical protein BpHYR1_019531 [Brachionus plicatilis]|uniref:RNA-directed DNA polymerase from mobile element jockey-like n=1 Tax=Brachionus plicatilis TaxID=10195 RepID=A0A3M7PUD3_BRAPC|nr:hypothetical protein BpHYR1_019531 [Brachionus plicatilis]
MKRALDQGWHQTIIQDKKISQKCGLGPTTFVLQHSIPIRIPLQRIRGRKRRLSGQSSTKYVQRENFLSKRVIKKWNCLPGTIMIACSVN